MAGRVLPKGLKREQELAYAASHFRTIEINGTFYGMQRPEAFASWAEQVPADFVFAVKAPRYITHILRLRDARYRWRTSSPPACCGWAFISVLSSGSSRRISASTPSGSSRS